MVGWQGGDAELDAVKLAGVTAGEGHRQMRSGQMESRPLRTWPAAKGRASVLPRGEGPWQDKGPANWLTLHKQQWSDQSQSWQGNRQMFDSLTEALMFLGLAMSTRADLHAPKDRPSLRRAPGGTGGIVIKLLVR
jgi:hypothetical protein